MRWYLLRHAKAVQRGTVGYPDDARRPLTEEGHKQARRTARGLKKLEVPLDLIVTSPFARALQTAEHVRRIFGRQVPLKEWNELCPEAAPKRIFSVLEKRRDLEHVLFVGHEPHLSGWLAVLVGGDIRVKIRLKKGGAACVEVSRRPVTPGSGELLWLMTAKHLGRIGRKKGSEVSDGTGS